MYFVVMTLLCFEVLYSLNYYYHTCKPWSAHYILCTLSYVHGITGFENYHTKLVMLCHLTKHTHVLDFFISDSTICVQHVGLPEQSQCNVEFS